MRTFVLLAVLGLLLVIVGEISAHPERIPPEEVESAGDKVAPKKALDGDKKKETPQERVARQRAAMKANPPEQRVTPGDGGTDDLVKTPDAAAPATGAASPATGAAAPATGAAGPATGAVKDGPAGSATGAVTGAAGSASAKQ